MAQKCLVCKIITDESNYLLQLDNHGVLLSHIDCFNCSECKVNLNIPYFVVCEDNDQLLCLNCYAGTIANFCFLCGQTLASDFVKINHLRFHQACGIKYSKISNGHGGIEPSSSWPQLTEKFLDFLNLDFHSMDGQLQIGLNQFDGFAPGAPVQSGQAQQQTHQLQQQHQQQQQQVFQVQVDQHNPLQQPQTSTNQQQCIPGTLVHSQVQGKEEAHLDPIAQSRLEQQHLPQQQDHMPPPDRFSQQRLIKEELKLAYPDADNVDPNANLPNLEDILDSLTQMNDSTESNVSNSVPQFRQVSYDDGQSKALGQGQVQTPPSALGSRKTDDQNEFLKGLIDETLGKADETNQLRAAAAMTRKRLTSESHGPSVTKKLATRIKTEPGNSFQTFNDLTNTFQPPKIVSIKGKPQVLRQIMSTPGQQSVIYQIVDDPKTSVASVKDSVSENLLKLVYKDQPLHENIVLRNQVDGHNQTSADKPGISHQKQPNIQEWVPNNQASFYGTSPIRQRAVISPEHRLILEEAFRKSHFPNRKVRNFLGFKTNLDQRQVQIWFQNQRSKLKKMVK